MSIWFKLTPLLKGGLDNPLHIIMQMAERYGPVIPINLANQRIVLLSEPEHFKHVLVTKADAYIKYFDGLKPIFGKSMITNDGALWQKIRMPQQPAFHPDMFAEYIPYFLAAIRTKMDIWSEVAEVGRDHRDGRADVDARRRHDLQGAVRPRHAVQSALRLQVREDLHRRDEPQGDPPQEAGGRDLRDHRGRRRQGDGDLGRACRRPFSPPIRARSASARC